RVMVGTLGAGARGASGDALRAGRHADSAPVGSRAWQPVACCVQSCGSPASPEAPMMARVPPTPLEQVARLLADSAKIAHGLAAMSAQQHEPDHVELFLRVAQEAEVRAERLRELNAQFCAARARCVTPPCIPVRNGS